MSLELLPPITAPPRLAARAWSPEEALVELVRGRLQAVGPTTAAALAASLGLPVGKVEAALYALEGEGFVMRGQFERAGGDGTIPGEVQARAGGNGINPVQWCERRLLARVHRYTLERLRREIDPVPQADFLRFLFSWQRVEASDKAEGPESLAALLQQLEGFETAAAAWEGEVLPVRLAGYDPVWLDALCLSGRIVWGRVAPPQRVDQRAPRGDGRRSGPVRATPIALLGRESLPLWQELAPAAQPVDDLDLSGEARAVHDHLRDRGASFFAGIAAGTGLLHTQVEEALAELVAQGLATADSFTGLRALLTPSNRRAPIDRAGGARPGGRRRGSAAVFGMENAGRWSLLEPSVLETGPTTARGRAASVSAAPEISPEAVELVAWTLLRRYGVVFRRLVERETLLPPWRDLLRVFRRLEARGEIRGGRFVSGFSGEQYALPDAVGRLRAIRKRPQSGELVSVSAADPLNLVGIVTPGARVSALAGNRILYRDGVPVAVHEGRETRFLVEMEPADRWQAQTALVRRPVPPQLKSYLGKSA